MPVASGEFLTASPSFGGRKKVKTRSKGSKRRISSTQRKKKKKIPQTPASIEDQKEDPV